MVVKAWEQEQKKGWLHCIYNQEADSEQVEAGYKNLRRYCPSNLLPPVWLHLLKISGLLLVTPHTGDQAWAYGGHLMLKLQPSTYAALMLNILNS